MSLLGAEGLARLEDMTESFPYQEARTRRFTLGVPRAFRVSPDGSRVAYLRTQGGSDPVTCLWVLDVEDGDTQAAERLVADPRVAGGGETDLPPEERARRERVREQAGGIVAYAADADLTLAVFSWSGRVWAVDVTRPGAAPYEVAVAGTALDPRPDPAGKRLAYVSAGALRVASLSAAAGRGGGRGPGAGGPAGRGGRDVRAARVHRGRGDGPAARLLVVPGRLGRAGGAGGRDAGTPLAHRRPGQPRAPARGRGLSRGRHPERRDLPRAGPARRQLRGRRDRRRRVPLPGQRRLVGRARPAGRGAEPGPAHGAAAVRRPGYRPDRGAARGHRPGLAGDRPRRSGLDRGRPPDMDRRPRGHPAPAGRRARCSDRCPGTGDSAGPSGARGARRGRRHRAVLGVGRAHRDRAVGLRSRGPEPDQRRRHDRVRRPAGGGTTVVASRGPDDDRAAFRVHRGGRVVADIASLAEIPVLPAPRPVLFGAGTREIRTAVLFPSWYEAGQGSCRCCSTRTAARTRSGC